MTMFSSIKERVKNSRIKTKAIAGGFILTIASIAALATMGGAAASPVSTPDCNGNAVVWCGASNVGTLQNKYKNGDGHNKASTIQDIYDGFGIKSSDVSGMGSDTVSGYVTKTGDVYAGSTLVASGAKTAGRDFIKGSTTKKYGSTTYYERSPSVSFENGELSAMVVMKGGVFQYAILNSCGNPVTAMPKKPAVSIEKQVRAGNSGSYSGNVSVKTGSEVQYEITADSNGQVPAENFTVRDSLPSDITYTKGSLELNGKAESSSSVSDFFGKNGLNLGTVKNGTKEVFTFTATAGKICTSSSDCTAETLTNTGYVSATGLGTQQSSATVKTICPTPPPAQLSCSDLTAIAGTQAANGDVTYTLKATATESNATISKYVFTPDTHNSADVVTVNTSDTTASTSHTYAPGTYTATVVVSGNAPAASDQKCSTNLTVKAPVSMLACEGLTDVGGDVNATTGDQTYTFTGKASAQNATIESYTFDFGDSSASTVVNSNATSATTSHAYAPGTYTATLTVAGNDYAGKAITPVTNTKCSVPIKVAAPTPSSLTCESLTDTAGTVDSSTGDQTYTFTGKASAQNATIESYTFDFGDGKTTTGVSNTATYTFAPGVHMVTLTVAGKDAAGNPISAPATDQCSVQITVTQPTCQNGQVGTYPNCTTPTCQSGQVGTYPNCTTPICQSGQIGTYPNCTTPTCQSGQTGTYPNCTTPTCPSGEMGTYPNCTTPPTTLPNTGAGDTIGIFIGAVVAGTVAFRVFLSRKLARR